MPPIDLVWRYLVARLHLDPQRDDRGAVSEYALVVFVALTTGAVVLGIIWAAIQGNAQSIPSAPSNAGP